MAKKVVIDCDPGIDDAVALCLALFDPRLEVLAVTAVEGNATATQSSRNVQALIEQLDPPRYPRMGVADSPDGAPLHELDQFYGQDGLGNCHFSVSMLQNQHPADKVICDVVRSDPGNISILSLGPKTNIARALKRDPEIGGMIREIVMMGGSLSGVGNVTACAEFNIYYDPLAAQTVFDSPTTKTLIPLDVTEKVVFSLDLLDQVPGEETRVGGFLRKALPASFRAHRQRLGLEGIHLHDPMAVMALLHPELFEMEEFHGQVDTGEGAARGFTIFDRRHFPSSRPNMEVAVSVDISGSKDGILRGLKYAGQNS